MTPIILFLIVLLAGFPIAFALLTGTLLLISHADLQILLPTLSVELYSSLEQNGLLAIPLFMLVGEIMNRGGLTTRLVAATEVLFGRFHGGLAYVNLVTNGMAAAILGSATAQISVMSKVMVPEMTERKYDKGFSGALTLMGGLLGPIIPPSMLMIIYGVVAYQSIAALFIAGILPGLLLIGSFALVIMIIGFVRPYPAGQSYHPGEAKKVLIEGLLPMIIPVVVIIGIMSGAMTPTESGAVATLLAAALGGGLYRQLKFADIPGILLTVALGTATITSLIAMATALGWVLTFEAIPDQIVNAITAVSDSQWFFLLLLNLLIIFLGMFLESLAVMIVIVPIVLPAALSYGIDPIHLGVIIGLSTLVGLVTPPVGPGLYIVMVQTGTRMGQLFRASIPFLVAMLASIVIINAVPALSTWLPSVFGFR